MYALRPNSSPEPLRRSRTASQPRPNPHRSVTVEATVKLTVNLALSSVAIVTLVQLLPYRTSQEAKLQELHVAVQSSTVRLQKSKRQFTRYFDPYQARAIMQEQSNRLDAQQRQIIWQEPKSVAVVKTAKPAVSARVRGY